MAFTPFEFVKLDPNALRSITVQNLVRKHGPAGAAVFMAILIVSSRKMDRTPDFDCNLTDIGFDLALEDDDVAAVLATWSAMSEKRGDGFRFTRNGGKCRIEWPEFMDCYPGIFKHRTSGDKRRESNGTKPEQTEANRSKGKQTRLEETRGEEKREDTPLTPLAGGRARDLDPDGPDERINPVAKDAARWLIPDLEKLTGPLSRKEQAGAIAQIALEIDVLGKAGNPAPADSIRAALAKWPDTIPRSIGIVKQRLHEQVMAKPQPAEPAKDPRPKWIKPDDGPYDNPTYPPPGYRVSYRGNGREFELIPPDQR